MFNEIDRGNAKIIDNFVVVVVVVDGGEPLKCDACLLDILYKETKFIFSLSFTNVISTHLPTADMEKDEMEESTLKRKSNKPPQTFMYSSCLFFSSSKENKRSRYHMYCEVRENKATTVNCVNAKASILKQFFSLLRSFVRLHSRGSAMVSGVYIQYTHTS